MVTKTGYNQIAVKAAYSVLIEIVRILGEYRENIVLIGGWVPQLLFQNKGDWHTGSIDVDLALNHKGITDEVYKGIHDLLLERKYKQYSDRLDDLIAEFRPYQKNKLVKEGLVKLAKNFASEEHTGPKFVADFEEITDEEDRKLIERDAFERVNYLLQGLGVAGTII